MRDLNGNMARLPTRREKRGKAATCTSSRLFHLRRGRGMSSPPPLRSDAGSASSVYRNCNVPGCGRQLSIQATQDFPNRLARLIDLGGDAIHARFIVPYLLPV